jgi:hypothetical protein
MSATMNAETNLTPDDTPASRQSRLGAVMSSRRSERMQRWVDLLAAILMAAATVATAWCGYQSALWGGEQTTHSSQVMKAIVRAGEANNLAMQRQNLHVNLFGQYINALDTNNNRLADFILNRMPEPLKTATRDWRAQDPLNNPNAPASPFDMPSYVLRERAEADRWEQVASDETDAGNRAGEVSDHYLLFTIIFASVLFFAGISGKFKWEFIDLVVLALGALTLLAGIGILFTLPLAS